MIYKKPEVTVKDNVNLSTKDYTLVYTTNDIKELSLLPQKDIILALEPKEITKDIISYTKDKKIFISIIYTEEVENYISSLMNCKRLQLRFSHQKNIEESLKIYNRLNSFFIRNNGYPCEFYNEDKTMLEYDSTEFIENLKRLSRDKFSPYILYFNSLIDKINYMHTYGYFTNYTEYIYKDNNYYLLGNKKETCQNCIAYYLCDKVNVSCEKLKSYYENFIQYILSYNS